jgi:hypothetical protein
MLLTYMGLLLLAIFSVGVVVSLDVVPENQLGLACLDLLITLLGKMNKCLRRQG